MSNEIVMDNIINIIKSFFGENEVVYISTPINTGRKYIDWYLSACKTINNSDLVEQRRKMVINHNIKNAKLCIEKIRKDTKKVIIDPTTFENEGLNWSQEEFYLFWDKVIKVLIDEIIFLDGWEYSIGCCNELLSAIKYNVCIKSQNMKPMNLHSAILLIHKSIDLYSKCNMSEENRLKSVLNKIEKCANASTNNYYTLFNNITFKDDKLDYLITQGISNIAQFVSFDPNSCLKAKYVHINNFNYKRDVSTKELITKLIFSSSSHSVNIRSFSPIEMKGNKLIFNKKIEDIDDIISIIEANTQAGKHTIINENISIFDSGVSGVALGDIIEFSPEDTPKCVDKEGICSLPRDMGLKILSNIYGFTPDINFDSNIRIEFSIHPSRQGVKKQHTIIWEYELYNNIENEVKIIWPNRFSKFIGDKVFGLLIADALGFLVPKTTVISRKIAPFTFGSETGLIEKWIRTSPIVKEPGKYYSGANWIDPFKLIDEEEAKAPRNINIASILSQDAVEALYSGASLIKSNKENDIIEGVAGRGADFMVGTHDQESLPLSVINAVKIINNQFRLYHKLIGDVSIEWVFDGKNVWVVQLNQLKTNMNNNDDSRTIVYGTPDYYEKVYVKDGLESLRENIDYYKNKNIGIELVGNVGITSHFGDLLRLSNIPSILSLKAES